MAIKPGTEVGGYVVEKRLGAGGMGTVYLAKHPRLPRKDALKILADGLSGNADFRSRFEREADLAGALNHPNIVAIYDRGEADEQSWIAMQYVDGPDAHTYCAERGRLTADDALWISRDVASALDHAHQQGLLHRDVKPANILLDVGHNRRRALLSDFGIARAAGATALTGTGMAFGSAGFSSPEQLGASPVDARSDVYALGCTLYALLTGVSPFPTDNLAQALLAHLNEPPPRLTAARPDLPPQVDGVIMRALAKNPAERYATAGAMVDDFEGALEGRAPSQPTALAPAPPQHTQVRRSGPVPGPPSGPRPNPARPTPPPRPPVASGPHHGYPAPTPPPGVVWPAPPQSFGQPWQQVWATPQVYQPPAKEPWKPPAPGPSIVPLNGRWVAALVAALLVPAIKAVYLAPTMASALLLPAVLILAAGVRQFIPAEAARATIWLLALAPFITYASTYFYIEFLGFALTVVVAAVIALAGLVWIRPGWLAAVLTLTLAVIPALATLYASYRDGRFNVFYYYWYDLPIYPAGGLAIGCAVAGLLLLLVKSPTVTAAYLVAFTVVCIAMQFAVTDFYTFFYTFEGVLLTPTLLAIIPTIAAAVAGVVEYRKRASTPAVVAP